MTEANELNKKGSAAPWAICGVLAIIAIVLFAQNRSLRQGRGSSPAPDQELARLREENRSLRQRLGEGPGLVGAGGTASAAALARGLEGGDTNALAVIKASPDPAPAIALIGRHAVEGDDKAVAALWRVGREATLAPKAVEWLGKAAKAGNIQAVTLLAQAEQFGLPGEQGMAALQAAAEAGQEKAVAALGEIVKDPARKQFWPTANVTLERAAAAGNAAALKALGREPSPPAEDSTNKTAAPGSVPDAPAPSSKP